LPLPAAGQGEQAQAVALSITNPTEQAEAVVGVAVALAQTVVAPIILIWTRRGPRRQARPAVPNGGYLRAAGRPAATVRDGSPVPPLQNGAATVSMAETDGRAVPRPGTGGLRVRRGTATGRRGLAAVFMFARSAASSVRIAAKGSGTGAGGRRDG
jgi:hypothetical protein